MNQFTHLDLCSGTGSFSLAFESNGFKTIGFSEIEPACCNHLKTKWPNVRNYGDIRLIPKIRCNVVSAGFPCQPVSGAGHQLGEEDSRWLWPSVCDVIKKTGCDFFLGENVIGIANLLLAQCQDDLERIGYQSQAFDIPSCAVGLQTVERHVWIVAARDGLGFKVGGAGQVLEESEMSRKLPRSDSQFRKRWGLPSSRTLRSGKGIQHRIHAIGNSAPPLIVAIFAQAFKIVLDKI